MTNSKAPAGSPVGANIADVVREAAARHPDAAALIGPWGTRTWAELDRAVDAGVRAWADVAPGERVVLALPTGPELAAALHAALRAGLIAVPVDPDRTDIGWVAERVGAHLVACAAGAQETGRVTTVGDIAAWWTAPDDGAAAPAEARAGGEDIALLARAGRSRMPVMLSHRAIRAAVDAVAGTSPMALHRADRVLQVLPLFHVVGLVTAFLPAALAGAAVVVPEPTGPATRAAAALAAIRTHRVSVLPAEPTLYRQLDRVSGFERALATVRLMTSGSSPLDPVDFAAIRTSTGQAVHEGYGISEAASAVTSTLMSSTARAGSVGKPYAGVEIRIENHLVEEAAAQAELAAVEAELAAMRAAAAEAAARAAAEAAAEKRSAEEDDDADGAGAGARPESGDGVEADASSGPAESEALLDGITDLPEIIDPDGGLGAISIRGGTLFSGYWPDGTDGPDEDGWFTTGDIGYLDDAGELHLVDRATETIKVAGFTVYPREIEDALVTHPYVADAAVVSLPARSGETVVAALVPKPGTRPTAADLTDFVADLLPPFKRPTDYLLLDALPRTEVGRLDRTAVRRDYAAARGIDLGSAPLSAVPGRAADDGDSVRPERAADLGTLGRRLPAGSRPGAGRAAQDTDDDLF